jgi:trehalose 6-phosphate synthase
VERLDPSKNTVRGIEAFDVLLQEHPCWRGRAQLLICLIPSRRGIAAYDEYLTAMTREVARVNDRWASPGWRPVTLLVRDDYFSSLAALQRYDVLFVSSISDGMNLVAKEGPLLNRRAGVLCLSGEAGAFAELEGTCLRVDPFDVPQTARALHAALSMPAGERAARARRLRSLADVHTPATWLRTLLEVAGRDR